MLAKTFSDPENARIIFLMSAGLVVLALLLAFGTVWWWRSSKVEHPALGPLEVMGTRSWSKGDYSTRKRTVEAVRPVGEVGEEEPTAAELVDLQALVRSTPPHFDDLLDPVEALALDDGREEAADADDADVVDAEPAVVLPAATVLALANVVALGNVDAEPPTANGVSSDGNGNGTVAEVVADTNGIDPLLRPNAVE